MRDTAVLDVTAARVAARGWLTRRHGVLLNEPACIHLTPGLIEERLLRHPDGTLPLHRRVPTTNH